MFHHEFSELTGGRPRLHRWAASPPQHALEGAPRHRAPVRGPADPPWEKTWENTSGDTGGRWIGLVDGHFHQHGKFMQSSLT